MLLDDSVDCGVFRLRLFGGVVLCFRVFALLRVVLAADWEAGSPNMTRWDLLEDDPVTFSLGAFPGKMVP